jgi:DNA-directed RNA polymerase subunit H
MSSILTQYKFETKKINYLYTKSQTERMDKSLAAEVYRNIIAMFGYRSLHIDSPVLEPDMVDAQLAVSEYLAIIGSRPADPALGRPPSITAFLLLAPGPKYVTRSANFSKLLKTIPTTVTDIGIVSDQPIKSSVRKMIARDYSDRNITTLLYDLFAFELPRHVAVPPHSIVPVAEVGQILHDLYITKDSMPRILASDPMAIWLDIRPGMVVKVLRFSETAGQAVVYRICI